MNTNEKYKILALELENMVKNQLIPFSTYLYYFNEYLLAKFDGTINTKTLNNIANSLIYCAVIDVNDEELFLATCDTLRIDVENYQNKKVK